MLKKIKKIKNLGMLFRDYVWKADLPEFKKVNLLYGWNGSGKTTLSCLFSAINSGNFGKHTSLEYEIVGTLANYNQTERFAQNIRIFNRDYVSKNIGILDGKANHIFILGEENQKQLDEIKKDVIELDIKKQSQKTLSQKHDNLDATRSDKFTNVARIISCNTSGEATRRYTKREAEKAFLQLKASKTFGEDELRLFKLTLNQREKQKVSTIVVDGLQMTLMGLLERSKKLLAKTVEAGVLERLKNNADISAWVESGLKLHEKHVAQRCEYCGGSISNDRKNELLRHFNEADQQLKNEAAEIVRELEEVKIRISDIQVVDAANLYEEHQKSYREKYDLYEECKKSLTSDISALIGVVNDKRAKTTESVELTVSVDASSMVQVLVNINKQISEHNQKTDNFKSEKEKAVKDLETHSLSEIYEDINTLDRGVSDINVAMQALSQEVNALESKIGIARSKMSTPDKACAAINIGLKGFLGREEIIFTVKDEGYVITRNGEVATELSEGEKTAIAFVYFVVHLKDRDFDITNGIIVVDDPISSLDSNSLFQAFAFLKNAVKNAEQIFIFTHNFDFLKLLLNWCRGGDRNFKHTGCYMLKNMLINGKRTADITMMDKTLSKYESEYHYLYSLLKEMCIRQDGSIEAAYPVPNIARKVFETFLMFRVPNGDTMYSKVEKLREEGFNAEKLTAIYKFVNDQSHITGAGFDPSLVEETRKNVGYLFDIMKESFPAHIKILEEAVAPEQVR